MNNKLYVGNLSYNTSEADLRELFGKAGTIRSVTIPLDRMTNRPRGFAFVEMETAEEASKAINMCNGQELDGRTLNVSEARPPQQRSDRGGDRGGYGGGRDRGGYQKDRRERGNRRY